MDGITLSHHMIEEFLACKRRFELRYVRCLRWPLPPPSEPLAESIRLGKRFHLLLQRSFVNLPVENDLSDEPVLMRWWQRFKLFEQTLPAGRRLPEVAVTVPIGGLQLTGRFDLLVLADEGATIYDWKTEHQPPSRAEMEVDLQSRVYLALISRATRCFEQNIEQQFTSLVYWYAAAPEAPVEIRLSSDEEDDNWHFLESIASEIERMLVSGTPWPLTDDLLHCRRCPYQHYCDRFVGGSDFTGWNRENEWGRLSQTSPIDRLLFE